jgi:hypothetical protein
MQAGSDSYNHSLRISTRDGDKMMTIQVAACRVSPT